MNNDDIKRKKEYEELSKKLLLDEITKRIKTTMIGSLDSIEKTFSSYFSSEDTRLDFLEKFKEARKRILDLGNEQMLKVKDELEDYIVENKSHIPKNLVKRK